MIWLVSGYFGKIRQRFKKFASWDENCIFHTLPKKRLQRADE
jgi:hypothetical protein